MATFDQFVIPASKGIAITPSDAITYEPPLRSLYVGGAGNVAITTRSGDVVTLTAVPVGSHLRGIFISKVMAANTTATLMVGFR